MASTKTKPLGSGLADIQKLRDSNPWSEDQVAEAAEKIEQALTSLNVSYSHLARVISSKCYYWIPTDQIPTAAVASSGGGYLMFLYNVEFINSLTVSETMYVCLHETTHLIFRHLFAEEHLRKDPTFEIANEVMCNHFCNSRLGVSKPPGNAVDPKKVYSDYKSDLTKQGLTEVSYDKFVKDDLACYSELLRMSKPPGQGKSTKYQTCVHQDSVLGDDTGSGDGLPSDEQTTGQIVKEAIEGAMKDALKGDSTAREELLDLAAASENASSEVTKFWGDVGLGALRGETVKTRQVEWWARWLKQTLGSRLRFGGKLIYPRKRAGILSILGQDTPMLHRGPERTKRVVRAIDTSGSMSQEFLDRFFKVTGQTSGVEWVDLSFDAVVMPYQAGERVFGGGGTSFQPVVEYVEGRLEVNGNRIDGKVDAVIVVTDGYAAPVEPAEPRKWIWLVTPGGDMWMDGSRGTRMDHHVIDLPE